MATPGAKLGPRPGAADMLGSDALLAAQWCSTLATFHATWARLVAETVSWLGAVSGVAPGAVHGESLWASPGAEPGAVLGGEPGSRPCM